MKKLKTGLPIFALLGVIALAVILGNIIIKNISGLNEQLANNQKEENKLQEKLSSLQSLNQDISSNSQIMLAALPVKNSVLSAINLVQRESSSLGLILGNLRSSEDIKIPGNLVITQIDFDVDGTLANISSFLTKMRNSTPITRFDTLKIVNQGSAGSNTYRLSASLVSYSSPLPDKIPALSEPLAKFTNDEQKLIKDITSFEGAGPLNNNSEAPIFLPTDRKDPFSS